MILKVKKLTAESILPTRAYSDDAGLDVYSSEKTVIAPGDRLAVATGIAVVVPSSYVGLIWDKSGLALKQGLTCLGGVIDASYRGELKVIMLNTSSEEVVIEIGQKIAQLLIQKIELPSVEEFFDLDETARGEGGFGSTGLTL